MKLRTAILLPALALTGQLGAATIVFVSKETVTPSTAAYDLTALGTSDWAIWNRSTTPPVTGVPTQRKSGGTLISTVTPIGTGDLRGSSTPVEADFAWSNGSPNTTGTATNSVGGVFSTVLDTTGQGVGFTISLPTTATYRITVWTSVFDSTGTFTASIPGLMTPYTNATVSLTSSPKPSYVYTIDVTADSANDLLTISNVLTTDTGGVASSSHVSITAAAISIVPEPSSALLLLSSLALGLTRRRR